MRILFDASSMPARRAGAGMVMYHLGHALAQHADQHPLLLLDRFGAFDDLAGRSGVTIEHVPRLNRVLRFGWEQAALPLVARRWRADVVYGLHHSLPLLPAGHAGVVLVHDLTFDLLPRRYTLARRWYMRAITRIGVARAGRVIVPSRWVRRALVQRYRVAEDKVHVVPLAPPPGMRRVVDGERLGVVRSRYGLPDRFLLSVGTLEPGKNREVVVRALRMLAGRGIELPLVVVGQQGWLGDPAARPHEGGSIRYCGYVPDDDLPALYTLAEALVFPSLLEGFGLPPLEALACGTPVVASNRPAMPEVLGDAALYADPRRPEAWAEAVEQVICDRSLRESLVDRGLTRVRRYSWERAAEETLEVFEAALSDRLGAVDSRPRAR